MERWGVHRQRDGRYQRPHDRTGGFRQQPRRTGFDRRRAGAIDRGARARGSPRACAASLVWHADPKSWPWRLCRWVPCKPAAWPPRRSTTARAGPPCKPAAALSAALSPSSSSTATQYDAGGTLQWASGNTQDVSSQFIALASGQTAILDTNGNDVTLASAISGGGSLTKAGSGTLTLTGADTVSGPTTVSGGALMIGGRRPRYRSAQTKWPSRQIP